MFNAGKQCAGAVSEGVRASAVGGGNGSGSTKQQHDAGAAKTVQLLDGAGTGLVTTPRRGSRTVTAGVSALQSDGQMVDTDAPIQGHPQTRIQRTSRLRSVPILPNETTRHHNQIITRNSRVTPLVPATTFERIASRKLRCRIPW